MEFTCQPQGPFELLFQNQYFNGWPTLTADPQTIVMAFPVEDWQSSAVVTLMQLPDGSLRGKVYGAHDNEKAKQQALAALSLDEDGSDWPKVGERDAFIGELQKTYHYMRPTLFHSPYEAAAAFVIGHRINIVQTRKIRAHMAQELGQTIAVGGQTFYAFPSPQELLTMQSFQSLNDTKIERLHAVAQAALDGWLTRDYLRTLDEESALSKLQTLPGIGEFFSQGILQRGMGHKDGFSHDDFTYYAIQQSHHAHGTFDRTAAEKIIEKWEPYRMWATVLTHVWARENSIRPAQIWRSAKK
ncbi:MAG TPA: hypothetical protein VLG92_02690 [Candidatus Saccharimonadia bacterium]|nr:hypothetical protein [Candidatus Saccharimonadia bacterium]